MEDWHCGTAADDWGRNCIEGLPGLGLIIRAGNEEQSERIDRDVGGTGTQADPTKLLAMESRKDGYVGCRGDESDQGGPESAFSEPLKRGCDVVGPVEGIQKEAREPM